MGFLKKDDIFAIKDRHNRHYLFKNLPEYNQYEFIKIYDERKIGRNKCFKLEFIEGPDDLDQKDGIWFGRSFSMSQYNRKRANVPDRFYRWTNEKILVNLMKCDIIDLTTYQDIAKRFLNEERM